MPNHINQGGMARRGFPTEEPVRPGHPQSLCKPIFLCSSSQLVTPSPRNCSPRSKAEVFIGQNRYPICLVLQPTL